LNFDFLTRVEYSMCLIFLSLNNHPQYKLIIAANRDEFYKRQTAPAHFWKDHAEIIGGRDLEASGTWMGMNKNGRIAMVTNYRDPVNINAKAPSRGKLVSDFLLNDLSAKDYLEEISQKGELYNGFNLIVGEVDDLWYYSNYKDGVERISRGVHGLSNHLLDTNWPKVFRGKEKFNEQLQAKKVESTNLFEFLYDEQQAPVDQLPNTGIGLEREKALSSMFIKTKGYGSRCSTVVLIDKENRVSYSERVYDIETFEYKTQSFEFAITE